MTDQPNSSNEQLASEPPWTCENCGAPVTEGVICPCPEPATSSDASDLAKDMRNWLNSPIPANLDRANADIQSAVVLMERAIGLAAPSGNASDLAKKVGFGCCKDCGRLLNQRKTCDTLSCREAATSSDVKPSDVCDCDHCKLVTSMIAPSDNASDLKEHLESFKYENDTMTVAQIRKFLSPDLGETNAPSGNDLVSNGVAGKMLRSERERLDKLQSSGNASDLAKDMRNWLNSPMPANFDRANADIQSAVVLMERAIGLPLLPSTERVSISRECAVESLGEVQEEWKELIDRSYRYPAGSSGRVKYQARAKAVHPYMMELQNALEAADE